MAVPKLFALSTTVRAIRLFASSVKMSLIQVYWKAHSSCVCVSVCVCACVCLCVYVCVCVCVYRQ
jgi:hypothetical protein